ncbi:Cell division protein FtsX [Meiothermus luteus]|uniref:Cell division protein FtsX n=1 Tax=Meiothermus luteus TaxID=2026184 RepID=A0A399EHW0_9DEIN|nr:permease-like cell division protein FtsX [Meiothermus luteus]RIH83276.1 Cell division protein FtsX [Meiothermus luteus]RMH56132.1 MAG: FtsX-like permease family protein [Deinococcota bacterium]
MYAFSQALRSLRQHLTSTLATFFTALVSFTLLFLLGLVLWNLDRVVASLERELEVAAFLKPEAAAEALLNQIRSWPEVSEVRLQTKEEALALLQLDYPYLAQAQEFVQNPLPDTLRIRLSDPQAVREVGRRVARLEGVEGVEYGGALTEQLVRLLFGLRVAVNVLIALLLLNTLFSVMGTIRLSIENRREELRVMQLVGATRRFIQGPFVVEGVLLTLGAAGLALVLGGAAYGFLAGALQSLLPFVPVLARGDLLQAGLALLLLALLLGALGAYLASRAHLRETDL